MKQEEGKPMLRKALPSMPDECKREYLNTIHNIKEDEAMKHFSVRTLLVTALVIVVTMGMALAAQQFGWVDFFDSNYGIQVSNNAAEEMKAAAPRTYEVGPMTFTFRDLITDKHIVMSACDIRLTDGSKALYTFDTDINEAVGASETGHALAQKLGIAPETTWLEAAKALNLPLYGVRGMVNYASENGGECMTDAMWDEEGFITYFSMQSLLGDNPDELPIELNMQVHSVNLETGDITVNAWRDAKETSLTATALLGEKTYQPKEKNTLAVNGKSITVTSLKAAQYVTGVYLTASFTVPSDMTEDEAIEALYSIRVCDQDGQDLPFGISLTGTADTSALPEATLETMASLETLPDTLLLVSDTEQVVLQ